MKLYLCGIMSYQFDLGIEWTAFADSRLERTLQGIKRDHQEPPLRERTPLTRPVLLVMLNRLTQLDYNDIVLLAAFSLAFAGFLRVGEFTYHRSDLDLGPAFGNWFLTKNSIRIASGGDYMELTLPASKTVTESTIIATIHCSDVGYCLFRNPLVTHIPYHVPSLLL